MRIGEFAENLGVSVDTVLRWERRGLIESARDWAGHRRYTRDHLEHARGLVFRQPQPLRNAQAS